MFFLKLLLFLFSINLHYSFKIISYLNRNPYNKLFMGCDYYIEQRLCIFYNDNSCYCINLKRERGYYTDYDDFVMNRNTQTNNLIEWEKIQQHHLTPTASPFIIYTNHSYINLYVANKYESMVEFEMIHNIDKNWDDIKDIVVYEERYERI